MIDVKAAVQIALNFIAEIYKDENLSDVRLEEVDSKGTEWWVTVGFRTPDTVAAIAESLGRKAPRDYKVVKVDSTTGEVIGMAMRQVQS